ncbi:hypothetical protein I5U18_03380 [Serratia ureilytica]|uniref:hypothetical protein n=1 Tax=Serratia ureilytica TaxID=300181 RepID=UPI0018D27732|nr:hypothetical protein [Serratia ureilytica]MBH1909612.1 hypothetical protein [Serratia ureilytica]QQU65781.1 hypothetical protein I6I46_04335 [Serratia ureilytica]
MARLANRKAVSSPPAIVSIDEQQDEVVMEGKNQRDLIASLYEELVIARGLIKEICTERDIPEPKASLQRMESAIREAKEYMLDNI